MNWYRTYMRNNECEWCGESRFHKFEYGDDTVCTDCVEYQYRQRIKLERERALELAELNTQKALTRQQREERKRARQKERQKQRDEEFAARLEHSQKLEKYFSAEAVTYVYFIQIANSDGYIKIGFTGDISKRIPKSGFTDNPYPINIISLAKGSKEEEGQMHIWLRAKGYGIRGEWFFPVPEILEIAKLANHRVMRDVMIELGIFDY